MTATTLLDDQTFQAIVQQFRAEPGRRDAFDVASGYAKSEAQRRQLNATVTELEPATFEDGERMARVLRQRYGPSEPDHEHIVQACQRYAPALPGLAQRHHLGLRTASALLRALASCPD